MNKRIWTLVTNSLLESSRNQGDEKRQMKLTRKSVFWRNVVSNMFIFLSYSLMTISSLLVVPVHEDTGAFASTFGNVFMLSTLMGFSSIYSEFMEEGSVYKYLPLPYTAKELFTAKFINNLFSSGGMYATLIVICWAVSFLGGLNIYRSLFLAVIVGVVMYFAGFYLSIILLYYVTKSQLFKKHKRVFVGVLSVVGVFLTIRIIGLLSQEEATFYGGSIYSYLFDGFRELALAEYTPKAWLTLLGWLSLALIGGVLTHKLIIPKIFSENPEPVSKVSKAKTKKTTKKSTPLGHFVKYHFGLIADVNVLISVVMSKIFLPLSILITAIKERPDLGGQLEFGLSQSAVYILVGFLLGYFSNEFESLSGLIISLERQSYNYIKTLPISLEKFLKGKFSFAAIFDLVLGVVLYPIIGLIVGIPFWVILIGFLGYFVGSLTTSFDAFKFDWKNLDLNWNNINELGGRGGDVAVKALLSLLKIILVILISVAVINYIWTSDTQIQWGASFIAVLSLVLTLQHYKRDADQFFWPNISKDPAELEVTVNREEAKTNFQKHRFFPKRPINWLDTILVALTSSLGLQEIFSLIYVIKSQGEPDLDFMAVLGMIATTISIFVCGLVIYLRKIPIINYKQLKSSEWKFIPGLSRTDWKYLAKYIPIGFVVRSLLLYLLNYIFSQTDTANQSALEASMETIPIWLMFLGVVFGAPIVEEWLFRGMIMFRKSDREPSWLMTVISLVLFAGVHMPTDLYSWLTYLILGLYVAYPAKKLKSVEAGIMVHMFNNLVSFIGMLLMKYM